MAPGISESTGGAGRARSRGSAGLRAQRLAALHLAPPARGASQGPPPWRPARGELRGALPPPPLLGAGLGGRAGHGSPGLEAPAPTPLPSPQRTAPPGTPGPAGPAPAEPPAPAEAVNAPRRPAAGAATHRPRPPRTRRPETGSSRSRRNRRRRRLPARQLPQGTARLARALSRSPQNDSDFLMNFIGSPGSEQAAQRRLRRGRRGAGDSTPLICGAAALRSMRRARSAPAPRRPARAIPGLAGPGGRQLCVPRASWGTPGCSGDAGGGRSSCIVDSSKEELTKEESVLAPSAEGAHPVTRRFHVYGSSPQKGVLTDLQKEPALLQS
ncbi:protein PRRC2A-like [Equus quagga]|uniref:protein PRRC2A-like n=1 Tax=Equus quagga TaxID=89248 RepID=UPI001EE3A0D8|nr:protein PRRC2A-like [Equus quagga]